MDPAFCDDLHGRLSGLVILSGHRMKSEAANLICHFAEADEHGLAPEELAGYLALAETPITDQERNDMTALAAQMQKDDNVPSRWRSARASHSPGLPSRAAQAARERRLPGPGCPLPPYLDPGRYLIRIRSGVTAQLRGLPRIWFVQLALGEPLQGPGYLGQQVRPAGRELAQPGHRDRVLGPGELPPLRVMLCRTRELGDKDTIRLRTLIDHAFYCHTELACSPARRPEGAAQQTSVGHLPSYHAASRP